MPAPKIPTKLAAFLDEHPSRLLKRGWPLFYQGEVPRSAYVVKKGVVKVYDINQSGEEKVVNFHTEGDIAPAAWLFDKSPVALYYYEAFSDCEIISVPREQLRDALQSDEETLRYTLDRYVSLYVGTTMHIYALEQTKANEKLLRILQYLCMRYGEKASGKLQRITLRLTHQDLARLIGMTRETTAVELGKLKKRGIINYQNQRYLVDTVKLRQALGEDEFTNLTI